MTRQTEPSHEDIIQILDGKEQRWDDIGSHLEIPYSFRSSLRTDITRNDKSRLEAIINKWFEGQEIPVTWKDFEEVLKKAKLMDCVAKIHEGSKTNRKQIHAGPADEPSHGEVMQILDGKELHWDDIGSYLEIPLAFRFNLRSSLPMRSERSRLEEIIQRWFEGRETPVTWGKFEEVLKGLKMMDCVTKIHKSVYGIVVPEPVPNPNDINPFTLPDLDKRIWEPGESGQDVVDKCIEKLNLLCEKGIFPDDKGFMKRLAFVMSRNGSTSQIQYTDGGIWQVSKFAFEDTKNTQHVKLPKKFQKLKDALPGIGDWRDVKRTDLEKPMYSLLAARLYISNSAEPIPPYYQIEQQQKYWWRLYMLNHEAKTHMQERNYKDAVELMPR